MRETRRILTLGSAWLAAALACGLPLLADAEPRQFSATLTATFYDMYGAQYPLPPLVATASGIGDSTPGGDVSLPAGAFSIGGSWSTLGFAVIDGFAVCARGFNGGRTIPLPGLYSVGGCGELGPGTTGALQYSAEEQAGTMEMDLEWYPGELMSPTSLFVTGRGLDLRGIGTDVDVAGLVPLLWSGSDVYASFTGNLWRTTEFRPFQRAPHLGISGYDAREPDGSGEIQLLTTSYHTIPFAPLEAIIALRLTINFGQGDVDGDGLADDEDNCVDVANPGQEDRDSDSVGDACDNCLFSPNTDQSDRGGIGGATPDGIGDVCQNGDMNADGSVDELDVVLLRRALGGEEAPLVPSLPPQ